MSTLFIEVNSEFNRDFNKTELLTNVLTNNGVIPTPNIIRIYNSDGEMSKERAFTGAKQMGNTKWTILYKSVENISNAEKFANMQIAIDEIRGENKVLASQVATLTPQVATLTSQVATLTSVVVDELVETKIRNTACNIVWFFLGLQPIQPTPTSNRFSGFDGKTRLKRMIKTCKINKNPDCLGDDLDALITRRNTCIHPQSMDALKVDVDRCLGYIQQFPQIQTILEVDPHTKKNKPVFENEIFVIEHYADFMRFAPSP
jgi:hypothetical protein